MANDFFHGKTAFITGAAAGIGYESALALAQRGARLVMTDVNQAVLTAAAQAIVAACPGATCLTKILDVTDEEQWQHVADAVFKEVGVPDVLINNAGIGYLGAFTDTPTSAWKRVIDINLMGVVHGCATFLPHMKKRPSPSHIVNIASAAGMAPIANLSAYVASKHAVLGLSSTLNIELMDSAVRVCVVCPGIINTAIITQSGASPHITPEQMQRITHYYQSHGCHPREVAHAVVAAIEQGRDLIMPGPTAALGGWLRRILPYKLFLRAVRHSAKEIGYLYP